MINNILNYIDALKYIWKISGHYLDALKYIWKISEHIVNLIPFAAKLMIVTISWKPIGLHILLWRCLTRQHLITTDLPRLGLLKFCLLIPLLWKFMILQLYVTSVTSCSYLRCELWQHLSKWTGYWNRNLCFNDSEKNGKNDETTEMSLVTPIQLPISVWSQIHQYTTGRSTLFNPALICP